ncbi:MAG: ATP-binding protein [Cyanobacteria bacterium P01_F01_bin.150]
MSTSVSTERSPLNAPMVCVADERLRPLDATLDALSLHHFEVDIGHIIGEVTPFLEQYQNCPGMIVTEQGQFRGMISRQQVLEWLINPRLNLFEQPIAFLLRMARVKPLVLAGNTLLLEAAEHVLASQQQRAELGIEPIVVRIDVTTHRLLDGTDLLQAAWHVKSMDTRLRLERSHIQMIQTEKMASLGRLVNGVAHEILDPVGFIWGNLCHISDYTKDLLQLIETYEAAMHPLPPNLNAVREEVELEYLQDDLPKAIASIQSGANRLKVLASNLQTFCYIDEVYPKPANIHRCLDSIVFLLENQLSGDIKVTRDYGALPPVVCYIGQLNQVFTNILSNAVQALLKQMGQNAVRSPIAETQIAEPEPPLSHSGSAIKPCIRITTQVWTQHFEDSQHRWISIQFADNGPGLSEAQYQQIHQSFAQQQPTGKETSLAVSHRIVTEKHDGKLLVRSPLPPDALPSVSPTVLKPETSSLEASSTLPQIPYDQPCGTEFQVLLPIQ